MSGQYAWASSEFIQSFQMSCFGKNGISMQFSKEIDLDKKNNKKYITKEFDIKNKELVIKYNSLSPEVVSVISNNKGIIEPKQPEKYKLKVLGYNKTSINAERSNILNNKEYWVIDNKPGVVIISKLSTSDFLKGGNAGVVYYECK
jgi:hypothetical protein